MSENIALSNAVYKTVCSALDSRNWHYDKKDEKLAVFLGIQGETGPINFIIQVDSQRQLIRVLSPVGFDMCEEKRVEGALATLTANYRMADGCFHYNLSDGKIYFQITAAFHDSQIGEKLILYMINCAQFMMEEYVPKFMAINKGMLSLQDFVAGDQ